MSVLGKLKDAVEGEVKVVEDDLHIKDPSQVPPFDKTCTALEVGTDIMCERIKGHVLPHSDLNGHDWS
jgi:hypothetical protein